MQKYRKQTYFRSRSASPRTRSLPCILKKLEVKFLAIFLGRGGRASGQISSGEGHTKVASRIVRIWVFVTEASALLPSGSNLQIAALRDRTATAELRSSIARLPQVAMDTQARSHRNSSEIEIELAVGERSGDERLRVSRKAAISRCRGSVPAGTASR